jgi:hypothetical protein
LLIKADFQHLAGEVEKFLGGRKSFNYFFCSSGYRVQRQKKQEVLYTLSAHGNKIRAN